jgi:hypothetical protein
MPLVFVTETATIAWQPGAQTRRLVYNDEAREWQVEVLPGVLPPVEEAKLFLDLLNPRPAWIGTPTREATDEDDQASSSRRLSDL